MCVCSDQFYLISAYECQPGNFACTGVDAIEGDGCVPDVYLCDGHEDCSNGMDEEGCDCKCDISTLHCNSQ